MDLLTLSGDYAVLTLEYSRTCLENPINRMGNPGRSSTKAVFWEAWSKIRETESKSIFFLGVRISVCTTSLLGRLAFFFFFPEEFPGTAKSVTKQIHRPGIQLFLGPFLRRLRAFHLFLCLNQAENSSGVPLTLRASSVQIYSRAVCAVFPQWLLINRELVSYVHFINSKQLGFEAGEEFLQCSKIMVWLDAFFQTTDANNWRAVI